MSISRSLKHTNIKQQEQLPIPRYFALVENDLYKLHVTKGYHFRKKYLNLSLFSVEKGGNFLFFSGIASLHWLYLRIFHWKTWKLLPFSLAELWACFEPITWGSLFLHPLPTVCSSIKSCYICLATLPAVSLIWCWSVSVGSKPGGGEIFRICSGGLWAHPVSCTMGNESLWLG